MVPHTSSVAVNKLATLSKLYTTVLYLIRRRTEVKGVSFRPQMQDISLDMSMACSKTVNATQKQTINKSHQTNAYIAYQKVRR